MVRGTDLGRLVFLRSVEDSQTTDIRTHIDLARCVAHPSLLKVVGRVETPDRIYVASEYISGVSLMELVDFAMKRGQRIEIAVSVRIVRDALRAASQAKRLLEENTGLVVTRSIFPDTVWIAEFGETMLTEAGVAPTLNASHMAMRDPGSEEEIDNDVAAAGAELLKLLTNQPLEEAEMTLPLAGNLAAIVARAVNPVASNRFRTSAEMADALSAVPADMLADEAAVGNAVRTLMASVLAVRHARRLMSVPVPGGKGPEDATCVFRDSAEFSPPPLSERAPPPATRSTPKPQAPPAAGIDASHPAYKFLAKHGLLAHASGLAAHDESEDKTLVMKPRRSHPAPSMDDGMDVGVDPDDPTELVRSGGPRPHTLRAPRALSPLPAPPDINDLTFAARLRAKEKRRRQVVAGSVALLVLLLVAFQLWV